MADHSKFMFTGAPVFVEEPRSVAVTNGSSVSFTCAVVSSPKSSRITWKVGNNMIIDERLMGDRFGISDFVSLVDKGIKTTSILTIVNVTGYDSNIVECFSQYQIDAATVASMVMRDAALSVLGEKHIARSKNACFSLLVL